MCIYSATCSLEFCAHTCLAELHLRLQHFDDGHCPWYLPLPPLPPPAMLDNGLPWSGRHKASSDPDEMDWEPDTPHLGSQSSDSGDDLSPAEAELMRRPPPPPPRPCVACRVWAAWQASLHRSFTLLQSNAGFLERAPYAETDLPTRRGCGASRASWRSGLLEPEEGGRPTSSSGLAYATVGELLGSEPSQEVYRGDGGAGSWRN